MSLRCFAAKQSMRLLGVESCVDKDDYDGKKIVHCGVLMLRQVVAEL